ncbi:Ephrin type-A receptor [Dirofilaria immitis]
MPKDQSVKRSACVLLQQMLYKPALWLDYIQNYYLKHERTGKRTTLKSRGMMLTVQCFLSTSLGAKLDSSQQKPRPQLQTPPPAHDMHHPAAACQMWCSCIQY